MAARKPKYPKHPPLLILFSMGGGTQTLNVYDPPSGNDHERYLVLPSGEIAAFCRKHMLYFARSRFVTAAFDIAANDYKGRVMFALQYDLVPPMKADLDKAVPKIMAYRSRLAQRG